MAGVAAVACVVALFYQSQARDAQAKAEVAQIMRRTGAVGGFVVALDGHGHELPSELESPEGIIQVFRL